MLALRGKHDEEPAVPQVPHARTSRALAPGPLPAREPEAVLLLKLRIDLPRVLVVGDAPDDVVAVARGEEIRRDDLHEGLSRRDDVHVHARSLPITLKEHKVCGLI